MMDKYTKGYLSYIEETKDIDMSQQYELFMKYVPKGSLILDAGFGSGRDIAFFKQHYEVIGIDISKQFVDYVKKNIHQNVHQMDILNLSLKGEFDAIWSCASQVHFDRRELFTSFDNYFKLLKVSGILYSSLKREKNEIELNGEHFPINELLTKLTKKYKLLDSMSNTSMINNQEWYSVILMKH
jgi:SAM-dependent methyltransferase